MVGMTSCCDITSVESVMLEGGLLLVLPENERQWFVRIEMISIPEYKKKECRRETWDKYKNRKECEAQAVREQVVANQPTCVVDFFTGI